MRSVLSVSLPEKISGELDTFARQSGRSKSDIIKESVALYLWEVRFNSLKTELVRRAKHADIVTEDDVFGALS